MDEATIFIRGIRAFGRHGALRGERDFSQPFEVDVELHVDAAAARASDALEDAVDYAAVHARVVGIVAHTSFRLLERLGDEILTALMRDERILGATLTIAKPNLLAGATPALRLSARRAL